MRRPLAVARRRSPRADSFSSDIRRAGSRQRLSAPFRPSYRRLLRSTRQRLAPHELQISFLCAATWRFNKVPSLPLPPMGQTCRCLSTRRLASRIFLLAVRCFGRLISLKNNSQRKSAFRGDVPNGSTVGRKTFAALRQQVTRLAPDQKLRLISLGPISLLPANLLSYSMLHLLGSPGKLEILPRILRALSIRRKPTTFS